MNTFYKKTRVVFFLIFFLAPSFSIAASTRLELETDARVQTPVAVDVLVDTEGQNINSVDIAVEFSDTEFRFVGYEAAAGVVSLWVKKPEVIHPGVVAFSGVIPGGVERLYDPLHANEKAFPIARLLFLPLKEGQATLSVAHAHLLKNDGEGSGIDATKTSLSVVVGAAHPSKVNGAHDEISPLPFIISQVERSLFGRNPTFITFEAVDQETGIHHYEVRIGRKKFIVAESPFELPHRFFPYTIIVRAFDFAGNTRDATLTVPGDPVVARGLFIAIVAVLAIVIYVYRKRSAGKL